MIGAILCVPLMRAIGHACVCKLTHLVLVLSPVCIVHEAYIAQMSIFSIKREMITENSLIC